MLNHNETRILNGKLEVKMSEFNKGAAMMRDLVISHIIGMQNDIGNDVNNESYQKLQELMDLIEERYGEMYKPFEM
jgi:hypothetical protein